ncbi:virulence RhuM family protein [Francisella hispaniensis]|uniref:Hydroxyacid dehydrogenase n=1 Tax=Francisella hispaniensis FSC454 TaxID=1088883 RepID=A0AAC9NNP3_9GAMM|nr:virulence RhuM family protein [Francisella hispaniensis]APD49946.1 hydroxyacid dehydrogenase [Francisella hispaniensis FSC454]KYW86265.1 hydroxyacid dehydrogenase [Francisella hispaniensis FSC454]
MSEQESNVIIYNTVDGKATVSLLAKDGTAWLSQAKLAELFATTKQNISLHISNIFEEGELDKNSVVKDYLTTASDGKSYNVTHYSLEMILAIGFRVRSKRGTQFRQWANKNLSEYMIKGFVIDDNRLKNPDGRPDYFDELLARIRDIRASEKRFYQKVRDLFMLSQDYDATDKETQLFYAETQNKLLFAITGQTAAELITSRADHTQPNMSLTSFKGDRVRKQDIYIAKNYLTADELDSLNRFVIVFLETAELRAKNRQNINMSFWKENIDRIIEFNDKEVLKGAGSVSRQQMQKMVERVYSEFDMKRKEQEAIEADIQDIEELKQIEQDIKRNNNE